MSMCNCDGLFSNHPLSAGCGGIFRDNIGDFLLAFAKSVSYYLSLHGEFSMVLKAIKIVRDNVWSKLWIETDSLVVI